MAGASLSDILTALQNLVKANNIQADSTNALSPHLTSGQLSTSTVITTGFTRLLGLSIVQGGSIGALYDTASLNGAALNNQGYVVPTTVGFTPLNMVFTNGVVYAPGTSQRAVFFYTKT